MDHLSKEWRHVKALVVLVLVVTGGGDGEGDGVVLFAIWPKISMIFKQQLRPTC